MNLQKEYEKKYGDVPDTENEILKYLLRNTNMTEKRKETIEKLKVSIENISWKEVSYIFYIIPKATPRPRKGAGNIFYVKGAKDNREFFKRFLEGNDKEFPKIHTPCEITIRCYFPTPSGMNINEQVLAEYGLIRPISKPDWDNVAKTYCDMIQDTVLDDDALIIDGTCKKFYSAKPRVELTIRYMEEFDSTFNYKKYLRKKKG